MDLNTLELEKSSSRHLSQIDATWHWLKHCIGDSVGHHSDQQELVRPNLLKLLDHSLEDMFLSLTAMKLLMEMLWEESLLVFVR